METSQKTFQYAVLNLPAFQLVMYVCVILIMWFGGNMILNSTLQVGELTGFLSYVFQVMNSMMMISNVFFLADPVAGQRSPYRPGAGRATGVFLAGTAGRPGARRRVDFDRVFF